MDREKEGGAAPPAAETAGKDVGVEDVTHQTSQTTFAGQGPATAAPTLYNPLISYPREKPISILVGTEKVQYFIHKGLFAAKSPYFNAMFKDCWDGKKEEVELRQISSLGFDVVAYWMYSDRLPTTITQYPSDAAFRGVTTMAQKAADVLMMHSLQNELLLNEAARLLALNRSVAFSRLKYLHIHNLRHTKYYAFILKEAVKHMMLCKRTSKSWDKQIEHLSGEPLLLTDVLRSMGEWRRNSWEDFLKGDLTEFLIKDADE